MNNHHADGARLESRLGDPILLKSVRIAGDLRGVLFEASVEQSFCNPTKNNVEVVYTFPLPWAAVLLGVEVILGDKQLSGAVVEKLSAEANYEAAICEGDTAIMLEQNVDHSYSLNLGNLAAGEDCRVTLRYVQALQFEQHSLRLLIPTVIAPRYGDPVCDGGLQPHQATEVDLLADYPLTIELRLHGELRHARVASPSHPLSFVQGAADKDEVLTLSLARRGALDRDFILILDQLRHQSLTLLGRDSVEKGKVVALASFCPCLPESEPAPLWLKILVDCSGSMAGDSIEAAKRSLQAIVQELVPGDRFALSRFGSTVEHRARGLWPLTDATQRAAQRWIGDLQADLGGTEMNEALMSTFRLANTAPSDVLIVTDGEISAIDSVIASAQVSRHRLYLVGIGSSPAESHLRRLAEATGGACDFVAPGEAVEPAVLRMFARLRSPRLSGISLEWPAGNPPTWVSPLPASVFDGDAVTVFAQFDAAPVGQVRLLGRTEDAEQLVDLGQAEFSPSLEIRETLARLAASQRVCSLYEQDSHSATQNAAKLAVDYQLVTAHTNFLLIAQRDEADRPKDMPKMHKVAQMLPAGWGGTGSVRDAATHDVIPAVVRRAHPALSSSAFSQSTSYDIPDFLRIPSVGKHRARADQKKPLLWVETADYTGLTPLGLCEWLCAHPKDQWPTTYQALIEIGVGLPLVDWLEMVIAHSTGWSESVVTAHWLDIMAHPNMHRLLVQGLGVRERMTGFGRRVQGLWLGRTGGGEGVMDAALAETITVALEGIRADRWPEQLFALTVA